MSRVQRNILANLAGGALNALLTIVLVPFYLHYLGIEAYGLVGFFATLQAVFGLMDLGLGLTLNRGLARLSVLPDSAVAQRDFLRTLETIYWTISIAVGTFVVVLAPAIANHWIRAQHLSALSVVHAVRLMGIIIALQFPFSLYQAGLLGLQRQVLVNVITTAAAAFRGFGVLFILAYISATVEAFFLWQAVSTLLQTGAALLAIWSTLSIAARRIRPRFRADVLRAEWKFAAAVSANAIIGAFLTQSDKIVLSGLLPLSQFGYYTLAGTVAAALWFVIAPVNTAIYPRLTQLYETRDEHRLTELYHTAAQVVAVGVIPAALTLIFFTRDVVLLWTHNAATAEKTALTIQILVAGTALNGLASVPSYLQSAAGWPQLTMYTNAVAAVLLVPMIIVLAKAFGAPGAAAVWLLLNAAYVLVTVPIMHRRLIRDQKITWYLRDVALPLAGAAAAAVLFRAEMPQFTSALATAAYIAAAAAAMLIAAVICSDRLRRRGSLALQAFLERRRSRAGAVALDR